jgi:hypothetical protein
VIFKRTINLCKSGWGFHPDNVCQLNIVCGVEFLVIGAQEGNCAPNEKDVGQGRPLTLPNSVQSANKRRDENPIPPYAYWGKVASRQASLTWGLPLQPL